jgi:hypothetical protein
LADALDAGAAAFYRSETAPHTAAALWDVFGSPISSDESKKQTDVRVALTNVLADAGLSPVLGYPTHVPDGTGGFFKQNQACQAYLSQAAQLPDGFRLPPFDCAQVWQRYARLAGDVLSTPDCQLAFDNADDWRTSRPSGGYSDE